MIRLRPVYRSSRRHCSRVIISLLFCFFFYYSCTRAIRVRCICDVLDTSISIFTGAVAIRGNYKRLLITAEPKRIIIVMNIIFSRQLIIILLVVTSSIDSYTTTIIYSFFVRPRTRVMRSVVNTRTPFFLDDSKYSYTLYNA